MSALPANAVSSGVIPTPNDVFGGFSALQIIALVLCFVIPLIGWALLFRQVSRFVTGYRLGQPDSSRTGQPGQRTATLLREFFGHTRMSRLPIVAIAHWFTALSFFILFTTLVNAFFQLVQPDYRLPIIGHFPPFEWVIEFFAWTGFIGIVILMIIRQKNHPRSAPGIDGRRSRFFGSVWWQAYYVEFTIFMVCLCIVTLRTLEAAMVTQLEPETSLALHFPLTGWMAGIWSGLSLPTIANWVYLIAMIKILVSFAWMITIALTPDMGIAWHRFLAFPNIWFKRESSGRTALGNLRPMLMGGGQVFSMEAMEQAAENEDAPEPVLGVGHIEDFTWKGLLDFSTCTECGRCQSQCPAWNTDKPLSPKLVMMTMRAHATAKAPYLRALRENGNDPERALAAVGSAALDADGNPTGDAVNWSELRLVGDTGYDIDHPLTAYNPHGPDAVIDSDVLWSCTTCGACVEQCPVDIEHVDHFVDMRRYQVLIESAFPHELGGLFKNLEGKGNPWGMGSRARLDWAKDLPFEVKVLGRDVEKASDVDWLFWVGCAGAYEDRAKKTTRAVAELLDAAGVSFAVLGEGETCNGDAARRSGNELLFQALAQQNVETFGEFDVKKIVVTCAHCFNTIKNEYRELGGSYEVLHHTQLLNRLVREKKLVPVSRPADTPGMSSAKDAASTATTVTYHDPCYLGRHNGVYAPPRELIGALPGVELREMERTKEKSFCCGAGGARMWMEEKLGQRINMNRTEEALATGAERIAIGCPFCRVMMSDGLTAKQAEGVGQNVEVVDVAQMLLAAVRRGQAEAEQGPTLASTIVPEAPASPDAAPPAAAAAVAAASAAATAPAATPPVAAAPVEADADPWDEPVSAAAPAPAPAPAEADPWDEPATASAPAPAPVEADPWDEPASATAAPAPAPAAAPPAADEPDPWDEPASGAAAPAPAPTAAPPAADEPDPWDEPASGAAAPAPTPAAAPPAADEPDPWDEPASATAAPAPAPTAAPPAADEPDPWDEPASATAAPAPAPAAAPPAADEPDPWDEPASGAAAPAPAPTAAPPAADEAPEKPKATGDPALLDEPDPWD